ncbi:hypothetical protein UACE39S_05559 [Ureibacillus acetophenoni]
MSLKKRKRTAIGKISLEKEFPKIDFEQAIDSNIYSTKTPKEKTA